MVNTIDVPDAGEAKTLAERLGDQHSRAFRESGDHGRLTGKINVRLIDDKDAARVFVQVQHISRLELCSRRISGRAQKDDLDAAIRCHCCFKRSNLFQNLS